MARPKGSKNKRKAQDLDPFITVQPKETVKREAAPIKKKTGLSSILAFADAPVSEMTVDTVIEPQVVKSTIPRSKQGVKLSEKPQYDPAPTKLNQLRPCPECGGENIRFDTFNHDHSVCMICHTCKYTGPVATDDKLPVNKLKYMAMAKWNTQ